MAAKPTAAERSHDAEGRFSLGLDTAITRFEPYFTVNRT